MAICHHGQSLDQVVCWINAVVSCASGDEIESYLNYLSDVWCNWFGTKYD